MTSENGIKNDEKNMPTAFSISVNEASVRSLAAVLGVNVIFGEPDADTGAVLRLDENGLSLTSAELTFRGDYARMLPRLKQNNLGGELLVRAAKIKGKQENLTLIDATAGMGEDSLLLAASGFSVTLFERDPVIAALLRDTLRRASLVPELTEIVARMTLVSADSILTMKSMTVSPGVIYLDPMFPERSKSALVKKKFQLLHFLEQPCADGDDLLTAALAAKPQKIVIKRPAKAPPLAGRKPDYTIEGKGIRYDCIMCVK